jgi:DNA-binding transcriptional LysR family regulator
VNRFGVHLHLLATFVEVCREGSFTKAALRRSMRFER